MGGWTIGGTDQGALGQFGDRATGPSIGSTTAVDTSITQERDCHKTLERAHCFIFGGAGGQAWVLASNGQSCITRSGAFEAKDGQILTLTIQSDIKGGSVDLFFFSPDNKEQLINISNSNETKTIKLSSGKWAYNCTGFFESGDITIIGEKRNDQP